MRSGVLDRLIGPQNKTLNETNPSINAKLPATKDNPWAGGSKLLHPVIAPPGKEPLHQHPFVGTKTGQNQNGC